MIFKGRKWGVDEDGRLGGKTESKKEGGRKEILEGGETHIPRRRIRGGESC